MTATVAALCHLALAALMGSRNLQGSVAPLQEAPGVVAMTVVWALPAALVLMGAGRRPSLLVAGGILSVIQGLTGLSVLHPLFVVSGVVYLVASAGEVDANPPLRIPAVLVTVALGVASFAALFALEKYEPCWTSQRFADGRTVTSVERRPAGASAHIETGGGPGVVEGSAGCSGTPTSSPAWLSSLALSALAGGSGWALSHPRTYRPKGSELSGIG